jgi:transcriptional regulator with XRE-family HTH domain
MAGLRDRFGKLTAAHRRRLGLTQEQLAEAAAVSVDMISKIEIGKTGASFDLIERLSSALKVDPAELFTTEVPNGALRNEQYLALSERLVGLSNSELDWIAGVVDAALRTKSRS